MIDKNGKLFGKVNLIDLLIVLVIVAVVAFVLLRVTGVGGSSDGTTPVRISLFGTETPDYVVSYIVEGEQVLDYNEDVVMGTVESFETGAPLGYAIDLTGNTVPAQREGMKSLTLNIRADAVLGENGATIGGELYGVGHTLTVFAGKAKLFMKISAIEPIS